ncbi:hypothetical protein XELAEV_18009449mg [Xenopus laevis]|uniref:Uncharacterized protein n=1 Tax=Xenopus laevis TaxID=8355 RepID=A0A974I0U1_XENLA|nr:hypothetical protein XELAEV_18009449mg [Xenopus laevis]
MFCYGQNYLNRERGKVRKKNKCRCKNNNPACPKSFGLEVNKNEINLWTYIFESLIKEYFMFYQKFIDL